MFSIFKELSEMQLELTREQYKVNQAIIQRLNEMEKTQADFCKVVENMCNHIDRLIDLTEKTQQKLFEMLTRITRLEG